MAKKFYAGETERPKANKKATPAKKPKFVEAVTEAPVLEGGETNPIVETFLDAGLGALQGATLNLADEGYGAIRALGDSSAPFSETYPKYRDEAREAWREARERSPIASTVGEVGGAIVSPASKLLGAGRGLRGITRGITEGAVQSYGATDEEGLREQALETATGAALGGVIGGVSNLASSAFSKSPQATRAEVLGVKGRDFRVDGPGDRRKSIDNLASEGFFKDKKMKYDALKGKFTPDKKSKFELDEMSMNTEERLLRRADEAIESLEDRKRREFGSIIDAKSVSRKELDDVLEKVAEEYRKRGLIKGPLKRREEVIKGLKENIQDHLMLEGQSLNNVPLRQIDDLKRMSYTDVTNFSKSLGDVSDKDELARILSRNLKELVENKIGHPGFKNLNSKQHNYLQARRDLEDKIASLELSTPTRPQFEKTNMVEKAWDSFWGGSQGRLNRADARQWYEETVPEALRSVIPFILEEAPGVIYRQQHQGDGVPSGNWRNPSSVVEIPEADEVVDIMAPQNMEEEVYIPRSEMWQRPEMINEELLNTPLPRNSQRLMENPNVLVAKARQADPRAGEIVQDMLFNDPEGLIKNGGKVAGMFPHLFERDEYNSFDGKIEDPEMRVKFLKDLSADSSMSSIEKAKLANKLHRNQSIY